MRFAVVGGELVLLGGLACSSSSTGAMSPSSNDAGASDGGTSDADDRGCARDDSPLPACAWDTSPYEAGFSQDRAARTFLACTSTNVSGVCLGVDAEHCAPGEDLA